MKIRPHRTLPGLKAVRVGERRRGDPVDWRRNLVVLVFANGITQFGIYFAQPFMPLFVERELHISDPRQAAFWIGIAAAAVGASLIVASPIWGRLADRYGRKTMAIRATGLGGLALAGMAVTQTPLQMVFTRFVGGAVAGNNAAISSLVSAETPQAKLGAALGYIGAATAIGRALAPLVAGLTAALIGLRLQFAVAGFAMLIASLPLAWLVGETDRRDHPSRRLSFRKLVDQVPAPLLRRIAVLITAQSLVNASSFSALQFLGLRLSQIGGSHASLLTGLTFALMGAGTAGGALLVGRTAGRTGYRRLALTCAAVAAVAMLCIALLNAPNLIMMLACLYGAMIGFSMPSMVSMVGLETPEPLRATIYGIGNSMLGLSIIVFPLTAGLLAASLSASAALFPAAGAAAAGSLLLLLAGESDPLLGASGLRPRLSSLR